MPFAIREWQGDSGRCNLRIAIDWAKRGRELAILVAIGTFLAIINPYGATDRMHFWQSWVYWVGLIIYGSVVGWATVHYLGKWFPQLLFCGDMSR